VQRSRTERVRGAPFSENADTSSDKPDENSGLSLLVSAFSLNGAPRPLSVLLRCTVHALLPQQSGEPLCYPRLRYVIYRQSFSARNHSMSQLLRTV